MERKENCSTHFHAYASLRLFVKPTSHFSWASTCDLPFDDQSQNEFIRIFFFFSTHLVDTNDIYNEHLEQPF